MQQRHFGRILFNIVAILVLAVSLIIVGCDDDDDISADDLANRTFQFADLGVFDPGLAGLSGSIAFGPVNANGSLNFTATINGTVITGTATLNTPLSCPANAAEQPPGTTATFPITVGTLEVNQNDDICEDSDWSAETQDGDDIIRVSSDDTTVTFTFEGGGTGSSTGTTGGSTTSQ